MTARRYHTPHPPIAAAVFSKKAARENITASHATQNTGAASCRSWL